MQVTLLQLVPIVKRLCSSVQMLVFALNDPVQRKLLAQNLGISGVRAIVSTSWNAKLLASFS
jgi:hypothetical protein